MSRAGIKEAVSLDATIDMYKMQKDAENKLKAANTELSTKIKQQILGMGKTEWSTSNWTAKVGVTENETFNEELAIEILKKNLSTEQLSKVVKTKEYIDEAELEMLIYHEDFDGKLLNECRIKKEPTYKLTISKKKK